MALASNEVFEFDDNKDGKVDNIFTYQDGHLIEHRNDRNYDGHFDYHLKVIGKATTIKVDEDFDHEFDRLEEISNEGGSSTLRIFRLSNGKRKLAFEQRYSNIQYGLGPENSCNYGQYLDNLNNIDDFVEKLRPVVAKFNNDFSPMAQGLQVHKSCFKNFGEKTFVKMFKNAMDKGLSCLTDLARQNPKDSIKGEISNLINQFNIQLSGKVKPISVICHEKKADWGSGEIAHASIAQTKASGLNVEHPFVSLNPKMKTNFFGVVKDGPPKDELEGIIFHEMIHNFGYTHQTGLDMSYACETCCFMDDSKGKQSACNICRGNYEDNMDPKYIRDLARLSRDSNLIAAESFIYGNLERIKIDKENLESIFIGLSPRGEGVQGEFLRQLKDRGYIISNSSDTKELLKDIKRYQPTNDFIAEVNKEYVKALMTALFEKNKTKAYFALKRKITSEDLYDISGRNERDSFEAGKLARGMEMLESALYY